MTALRVTNGAIVLALVVILLGGWTRLNDAGLGCPDWPGCFGTLVLPADMAKVEAVAPQYGVEEVDIFKGWLEMIHRYGASTLGLVIMGLAYLAWRNREVDGYPVKLSFLLLGLVIAQGIFGMWTVTMLLLPIIVTTHLLGGLTTLTLLVLLRQSLRRLRDREPQGTPVPAVKLLFVALFLQLALGGWTSTNYAGWACTDWVYCHADYDTKYDFAEGLNPFMELGHNYEGGKLSIEARTAIQVTHRFGALILTLAALFVMVKYWQQRTVRPAIVALGLTLGLQIVLGFMNVIYMVPLSLAVAHHAVAVLVLLSCLKINGKLRAEKQEAYHGYAATV
ncbi:MAG: COX15/CtaA family protein [Oceanospirillaceae bacterium]|nr:COX15/CtaA family protein [Oceanospirillaceae bacterium]